MPDVKEAFRAATDRVDPDVGFVERQHVRQVKRVRTRKIGTIIVVAVVIVTLVGVGVASSSGRRTVPASGSSIVPSGSSSAFPFNYAEPSRFVDLDNGSTQALPSSIATAGYAYPVSPDGSRFAFYFCCNQAGNALYVADVDGTNVRVVTPEGVDAYGARWSADGGSLVFQEHMGDLFVIDVETGEMRRVARVNQASIGSGWWFMAPAFGPARHTIVFDLLNGNTDEWDLWSVPVTGGEPTLIKRDAGYGSYGPDGTLAYLSPLDAADGGSLWVDASGETPRRLATGGHIEWPRWSPDGTKIAYSQNGDIYVVDVASGGTTKVASGGVAEWFDDHTLVVGEGGCPGC
jgi:dipeptidyl aminopeptidase/acylaminoacyl peptidase